MTLCADDGKTTSSTHFIRKFDVGTTTSHVGGDGDSTKEAFFFVFVAVFIGDYNLSWCALTRECHDVGFLLVEFSVEHLVWNAAKIEQTAEQFGDFHRTCTNKHGTSSIAHLFYFFDDCIIFFTLCLVDTVVHIVALNGTVSWNFYNVEFIDVPEFACFRDGSTRHTSQLVVHAEVVLEGDGSECLSSGLHTHVFLRFNGLVQTIAPTTTFHDTTC